MAPSMIPAQPRSTNSALKDGLRQLLERKDKAFVLRELVQNAWDEPGVTRRDVTLEPIRGRPAARLVVEDLSIGCFLSLEQRIASGTRVNFAS